MPTIQDQNLSTTQVIQLTQAMLSVALVDGMPPAEAALIGQFYESSRSVDMPTTSAMLSGTHAFDAKALAGCPVDVAETGAYGESVELRTSVESRFENNLLSHVGWIDNPQTGLKK